MSDRFAYLILEHADLQRALRLAAALRERSPGSLQLLCYNGTLSFEEVRQAAAQGLVRVGSGSPARWGDDSLLQRTVEAVEDGLARDWTWIAVLTGQDYPCGDLAAWERRVVAADVDAVNRAEPVTPDDVELVQRYGSSWSVLDRLGGHRSLRHRAVVRALKEVERRSSAVTFRVDGADVWVGLRRGGAPTDLWKGLFWTAMTRSTAQAVLGEYRSGVLAQRLRRTLFPEEAFVPTVLRQLGLRVAQEDLTTTLWDPADPAHPRPLELADLPDLLEAGAPFARKFTGPSRAALLEALDADHRLRRQRGAGPSDPDDRTASGAVSDAGD